MRVLFTDKYRYVGKDRQGYEFVDEFGDYLITSQAKLVDKTTDYVIMFLEAPGYEEDIQYSYSTQRKVGLRKVDLSRVTARFEEADRKSLYY